MIELPDATVELLAARALCDNEKIAGLTVMPEEVTESVPSDAVRVREPAVLRVELKEPTPLVRVADEGSVALESLEVMATVPE